MNCNRTVAGKGSRIGADHFHSALLKSADLRAVIGHDNEALLLNWYRTVACNAMHSAGGSPVQMAAHGDVTDLIAT